MNDSFNKRNEGNKTLNKLKEKGITLYLTEKGEINYRFSPEGQFTKTKDFKSLENICRNLTGEEIDFSQFYKKNKKEEENKEYEIKPEDLMFVTKEVFNPMFNQEFILQKNGAYYLNKFRPSSYMLLENDMERLNEFNNKNSVIIELICHLTNYDREATIWVINWLAYFFQKQQKSQVALVLLGDQGAGKGIFSNEIIKPLFGEYHFKTVNDKSLDSRYLGSLVEDTLFFNLDEISANKSLKNSVKNFLKALVTNKTITVEKKFKNLEKETEIFGQILITSNESFALEIEPSDRRFTVKRTAGNLSINSFLGYGDYKSLSFAIKDDLELFAIYLKNYTVDEEFANRALNTYEKDNLIAQYQRREEKNSLKVRPKLTKLQTNILEFINAIKFKNFNLFDSIIDANKIDLRFEIITDLQNNVFRIKNLLPTFKTLYGGRNFGTNSEFLRELQHADFRLFALQNIRQYKIGNELVECIVLPPIYHGQFSCNKTFQY